MIRPIYASGLASVLLASLASAGDTGVSPKPKPSDYPVHQSAKTATIAAAIVPPDRVKKIFDSDTAKNYVVVEVAIYPQDSRAFNVDLIDFELNTGEQFVRASEPGIMANNPPPSRGPSLGSRGPTVTAESGIYVSRQTDPTTGRPRTSAGTYQGVAVTNYPTQDPPPPPMPSPKQGDVDAKLLGMALPTGPALDPVAGYLYFRHQRRKQDTLTLNYSTDDGSVDLKFPK